MPKDKSSSEETREIRIIIPRDLTTIWLPRETRHHVREAIRQTLLAVRSMIDAGMRYYEDDLAEPSREKRVRKVKID